MDVTPCIGHNTGDDMPLERLAILENEMKHLRQALEERQRIMDDRMQRIEATHENIEHTLNHIAGLIRDQSTERKLLGKLAHVIGWIIALSIGWYSGKHLPTP